ncbi:hypothetical protein [Natrinema altunense]|uniref:hypothetical protein n=1 Tax=Natrinema altunense TaxID=222984 RepID=UPI00067814CA|nr:hypothetical protein [Natrinema altunense]
MKPDQSGVIAVNYGCHDCEFGGEARNGVGLAAQHAEKYGHSTWAEQITSMEWNVRSGGDR